MRIKRIISLLILALLTLVISACTRVEDEGNKNEDSKEVTFQILTVNDTHGYLEDSDSSSMSKIAAYIKKQKYIKDKETITIAVGDMFQGTAVSNLTQGLTVVDCMNEIGFDAMTIGNHEFDWGIEAIDRFNDGNLENGEAEFPFLAANITYKGTDTLMEFTKPYEIIERQGVKVGIIGTIGEELTNSISARMVADYEFQNVKNTVEKYAKKLRAEEGCDIVILGYHSGSDYNNVLTALTGDARIDAILNAHTHIAESKKSPIPQIQAKSNGEYVGELTLTFDKETKTIVSSDVQLNKVSTMKDKDTEVAKVVNDVLVEIQPIIDTKLATMTTKFNKSEFTVYGCKVIQSAFGVDFAMVNAGGYRTNFNDYQAITFGDMIQMIPFDNEIKLVTLTGAQVISIYGNSGDIIEYPINVGGKYYDLNGKEISSTKLYRVAAIDYIFDKTNYEFLNGINIEFTGIKFRDIFVEDLKLSGNNFNMYGPAKIGKIEW